MREVVSRSTILTNASLEYLKGYIDGNARQWGVPTIASVEMGYRDIFTGVRDFPAIIGIVRSRKEHDSFSTSYHMLYGLALKGADIDLLQEEGERYADLLEDAVRMDGHLGGIAIETTGVTVTTDCTGGFYIISLECDVLVDRGAFANQQEEQEEENKEELSRNTEEDTDAEKNMEMRDLRC